MVWWHRLYRWFWAAPSEVSTTSRGRADAPRPQPTAQRATQAAPSASAPLHVPMPAGVMLRREELLDAHSALAGFRLTVTPSGIGQADVTPQGRVDALNAGRSRHLAERRTALITVPLHDWDPDLYAPLTGPGTVFETAAPDMDSPPRDTLDRLRALQASGASVALRASDDPALAHAPIWDLASHAMVRFDPHAPRRFEQVCRSLRAAHPHLRLITDGVPTWPEHRLCASLGASLVLGDFLHTVDEQAAADDDRGQRSTLLELLNLVRCDAELARIAEAVKREPGVAVHLLAMANAPAYGLRQPLTGIEQAVQVIGRDTLYRWLAVAVFRAGADAPRDATLLEVALARARFLELAGQSQGHRQQADELFLLGLLSFIDKVLGRPMAEVLGRLSVPSAVLDVLLRNEGPYLHLLTLAISIEKCLARRAQDIAQRLGFDLGQLHDMRQAAVQWAEDAAR